MTPRTLARAGTRVGLILAVLAAGVVLVSVGWPIVAPRHMLLFAHHGDLSRWPENSLEGLVAAAESGLDGVEIDVVRSADGTWWAMHDESVDRTTNGTGSVAELSDAEMRALLIDGGIGFDPTRHRGLRLHTLDETLDSLGDDVGVIVDIKSHGSDAHADVARILTARGLTSAYVICQSPYGAAAVKRVDDRLRTMFAAPITWRAEVDYFLAYAQGDLSWPQVPYSDLFGDVASFTDDRFGGDEAAVLDKARRWGVSLAIVNNPDASLAWRASVEGGQPAAP